MKDLAPENPKAGKSDRNYRTRRRLCLPEIFRGIIFPARILRIDGAFLDWFQKLDEVLRAERGLALSPAREALVKENKVSGTIQYNYHYILIIKSSEQNYKCFLMDTPCFSPE